MLPIQRYVFISPFGPISDSPVVMTFMLEIDGRYEVLLFRLKSRRAREHLAIKFLWATARLLVTRVILVYLVLLGMSFSLYSWCS